MVHWTFSHFPDYRAVPHPVLISFTSRPSRARAFSLIELAIAIAVIILLLSILLPALRAARASTHREVCADRQHQCGQAWFAYLQDHDNRFPADLQRPEWNFGGVRFGIRRESYHLDAFRPLTPYLVASANAFLCPADTGIHDYLPSETFNDRAFDRFGTSYRANPLLFDASALGLADHRRPLARDEITALPSRLILMGDAPWLEFADSTGASADWHIDHHSANLLFLDGSVRFAAIRPRTDRNQPIEFSPVFQPPGLGAASPLASPAQPAP